MDQLARGWLLTDPDIRDPGRRRKSADPRSSTPLFASSSPQRQSETYDMSGPSTYVPKSAIGRWFESRLPLMGLIHSSFIAYPVPRNLNYMWTFGAILSFMLIAQIITGVVLAMHYVPSATEAFSSVNDRIMRDVNYGWLIRYMHSNGASLFFLAGYIHMFRGLYYGSFKPPREVLWIIGVIIYFLMMATAFMGYVLPWGSMSFAGATVITNLTSAIPLVGNSIAHWLWGGFAVGGPTLNRFFSLHYLLPFIIVAFVGLHVWALHIAGQNNPDGVEVKDVERDTVAFTPYATIKDVFGLSVFLILYAWLVFYIPNYLLDADNSNIANPLATPAHVVPEWYLLPFYAMLRAIPNKLMGVIVLFSAIVVLAFIPWLDRSPVKSAKYRPAYRFFFWVFVVIGIGLGYLGSQEPTEGLALIARILTFGYFAFFLIIMPVLSFTEKTKPIPTSIADAVLTRTKTAAVTAG
jgi:ubiquinol-cytochrome c reductase cytochrome b subunit